MAAAIGAVAGMMAAPLVSLDPDMMSGILEINDRTNDSSLVTFQAPLHQVFKGNPVERDMAHQSHYGRKQLREHELR